MIIHGLVSNDVPVSEVVISICNGDGAECKKERNTERKRKRKRLVEETQNILHVMCFSYSVLDGIKKILSLCCMGPNCHLERTTEIGGI
jgi:hypothetical protein